MHQGSRPPLAGEPIASDRRLDSSQLAVIALPDDADAVVLGAGGTGKTEVVVELVADRLLHRGWSPDSVLVLGATRASAGALRDRLARRVGIPTPGPLARTVASLAFEIVRADAAHRGAPAPSLLSGADQDRVVADLLLGEIDDDADASWPAAIDRSVRELSGFRAELRELQARLLERGVTPAELASIGREQDREAWVAGARFLASLEAVQDAAAPGAVDSTELLVEAAVAVDRGAPVVDRLRLVVVDDAQELGIAGLRLIVALARAGVRVIALGDPDLATGGFRGAVPGGFTGLAADAGRAVETIVLPTAHRQAAAVRGVVAAASGRIGAAGAGVQRSAAAARDGGVAESVRLRGRADEVAHIARRLRERRVRAGVPWSAMAVVVRSGGTVTQLIRELRGLEVPAAAAGVLESPRDDAGVRALVLALEIAIARREPDPESVAELLGGPLGRLDAVAIRRLRAGLRQEELAAGGDRGAGELLVLAFEGAGDDAGVGDADGDADADAGAGEAAPSIAFSGIDTPAGRRAHRVAASVRVAAESAAAGATIEDLVWGLWDRSGLAPLWADQASGAGLLADEANRHLDAVVAFFAAAKRFAERRPDAAPGQFLDAWRSTSVQEDSLAPRGRGDAVLVATPSALVGRQFDTVIIAGLQDGTWPNPRIRGSLLGVPDLVDLLDGRSSAIADRRREVLHDELRLFAATVARAESVVVATAVDADDEAPSALMRLLPPVEPSADSRAPLTLRGLVARLRNELTRTGSRHAALGLARLAAAGVPGADPAEWAGLADASTTAPLVDLDDPDAVVPVSPSRIEAFEACELDWAIAQLGGGRSSTSASLGTLVHAVAQDVAGDEAPSAADLLERVEARWGELEFEADWASDAGRARAVEITRRLAAYLRDQRAAGTEVLGTELGFELPVGRARLRGQIDRLERYADGAVLVVDLKTGKEAGYGKPESVADHAQLAAYQLAVREGAVTRAVPVEATDGGSTIERVPVVPPGTEVRGAALVILGRGSAGTDYVRAEQAPYDDERIAAFDERVGSAARGMAGASFTASVGTHCLDPYRHGSCRVHVPPAVTS